MIINRPPEELYRFWLHFEDLPLFMDHLVSVKVTGSKRSHWVAKAPVQVEWDAEIAAERPGELIGWRSVEGSTVRNAGSVVMQMGMAKLAQVETDVDPAQGMEIPSWGFVRLAQACDFDIGTHADTSFPRLGLSLEYQAISAGTLVSFCNAHNGPRLNWQRKNRPGPGACLGTGSSGKGVCHQPLLYPGK